MGESINSHTEVVGICGASGFIGSHLVRYLTQEGYQILPIERELLSDDKSTELAAALTKCDSVINVAGIPINHRWSKRYKQQLYESRAGVARKLVAAMAHSPRVKCWICASAVGYYPTTGCYDEYRSDFGSDYLADLCRAWEQAAQQAPAHIRTLTTRFGVVLSANGGAFPQLARPAQLGVAVTTGSGKQYFSWIDIEDLCHAMYLLLSQPLSGTFNLTAPQRITMHDTVDLLRLHYRSYMHIRVPEFVLRTIWGEAADFLVNGSCVLPTRLLEAGFNFHTPDLETFLRRLSK